MLLLLFLSQLLRKLLQLIFRNFINACEISLNKEMENQVNIFSAPNKLWVVDAFFVSIKSYLKKKKNVTKMKRTKNADEKCYLEKKGKHCFHVSQIHNRCFVRATITSGMKKRLGLFPYVLFLFLYLFFQLCLGNCD